ncbi:MAG: hypothetical protein AB7F65_09515 [Dehalococcoidia bacterium]
MLLVLGLLAYRVPHGTLVSAQVDDSWQTTEHAVFSAVLCEGPDGQSGTPDDRPRNNPTAGGTATLAYDATSDTWGVEVVLTSIRAGTYRLTIGRFGSPERTVLTEFSATDDPANATDHVDVTVRANGLPIATVDEYSVLEVERNGPPWGGGGACTGDHAGQDGSGGSGGGHGDGSSGCEDGDEGDEGACDGGHEDADSGCEDGDEGDEGACDGGHEDADSGCEDGDEGDEGACAGGHEGADSRCEDGDEGGCAESHIEAGTACIESTDHQEDEGGCDGGAGSQWRAELQARFSLSRVATITLRQDVATSGVGIAPAGASYEDSLSCTDQAEPRTFLLGAGDSAEVEVLRGSECSVTQAPTGDGSTVSVLNADWVVNFDTVVTITNQYHVEPPVSGTPMPARSGSIDEAQDVPSDGAALSWTSGDGSVRVEVPSTLVAGHDRVLLTVSEVRLEDAAGNPNYPEGTTALAADGRAFVITLHDARTGDAIALEGYVSVSIELPRGTSGSSTPRAMRWDEGSRTWVELPSVVEKGVLTFETDHLSLFGVFELGRQVVTLRGGRNPIVFTGADGTRVADFAKRLGVSPTDVHRLTPFGQEVGLDTAERLVKGEALVVVSERSVRVAVPAFLADSPRLRVTELHPGLNVLPVATRDPVGLAGALAAPGEAISAVFYFDAAAGSWEVTAPSGPPWLSRPVRIGPFSVVFVVASAPAEIAVPDSLLGRDE